MWILCTIALVSWLCYQIPYLFVTSFFVLPFLKEIYERKTNSFLYSMALRKYLRGLLLPLVNFELEGELPVKPRIYAVHPHGPLALGQFLGFMLSESRCIALVSEELMVLPVVCELLTLLGARVAERDVLELALQRGESVILTPGGVREMALPCKAGELNIKRREAFLRHAFEHKIEVVPCVMLGEHSAYTFYHSWEWLQNANYRIFGWQGPNFALGRWNSILPKSDAKLKLSVQTPHPPNDYETESEFIRTYYEVLNTVGKKNEVDIRCQ
jgi:Diacylglycerol acyltransferase